MTSDSLLFGNAIGSISSKSVKLYRKNSTEEIRIQNITAIEFKRCRDYIRGVISLLLFVFFVVTFFGSSTLYGTVEIAIFLVLILFTLLMGVASLIGHHEIIIITGFGIVKPLRVEMAKTKEGVEFYQKLAAVLHEY